jgi:LemA protein
MRKLFLALLATLTLSGCGYNEFQRLDEAVTASWSEVVNNYQRRADLIPNLVATVKGAASFEKGTLEAVVNARASVGQLKVTPEMLNDPAAFANFEKAQAALSGALSRLLAVAEAYPQLKATEAFRDLMSQLEGVENRITVARGRYIKTVEAYNVSVRSFPNNLTAMMFGYKPKPNFTVANEKEISVAPKVDFDKSAPAPAPAK